MFRSYRRVIIRSNLNRVFLLAFSSLVVGAAEIASIGLVIPVIAIEDSR